MKSRLRPAVVCVATGLALRVMLKLADAAPSLPGRADVWTWMQTTNPTTAAAAVLGLVVRVLTFSVAGGLVLEALARLTKSRSLRRVADRAAGPLVRHLVAISMSSTVVMGVGVTAALPPAPVAAATIDQPPDDLAIMRRLEQAEQPDKHVTTTTSSPTSTTTHEPSTTSTTAANPTTTTAVPPTSTTSTTVASPPSHVATTTVQGSPRQDPTPTPRESSPARAGEHVVRRGEHFWSIADATVSARLGRPATDEEIDGYWRQLIDANRDRLVVPGDPDVLMPGQALRVPAA